MYDVSPTSTSFDDDETLSGGAIAGIVVGCIAIAVIISIAAIYFRKQRQQAPGSSDYILDNTNPMYRGDKKTTVYKYEV